MDSPNAGQDVEATLLIETNHGVPDSNTHTNIDCGLLTDETFSNLREHLDWSSVSPEESPFLDRPQMPVPETPCSTSGNPEIQFSLSPSQFFAPNGMNHLTNLTDYPETQFSLNSTFNSDLMDFLDVEFLNSALFVDSSTASMPSDRSIESRNTSLQLSSPGAGLLSDTEGSSRQKAKPMTTRKRKVGDRRCDRNREERKIKKPLHCSECDHSSAWLRDLKRHIRSCHPEKAQAMGLPLEKYTCEFPTCKSVLTRKDRLKRHLRKQHGVVSAQN